MGRNGTNGLGPLEAMTTWIQQLRYQSRLSDSSRTTIHRVGRVVSISCGFPAALSWLTRVIALLNIADGKNFNLFNTGV